MTPEEFREARKALGLSAADAARVLGYSSPDRIWAIESGQRKPSAAAQRLLRAYVEGYRPSDWPVAPEAPAEAPAP